jgi:hypothetical protein
MTEQKYYPPSSYFEALYGEKEEDQHILIWTHEPEIQQIPIKKRKSKSRWFTDLAKAEKYSLERSEKHEDDVYVQVSASDKDYGPNHRNSIDDNPPVMLPAFYADLDMAKKLREDLPQTLEEALSIVKGNGFDPSMIVHSGHGLHAYWIFKEPWDISDPQELAKARTLSEKLSEFLVRKAGESGWKIDSIYDLVRVLRVPGTENWKNPKDPAKVILWDLNDLRWEPDEIEEALPTDITIGGNIVPMDLDGWSGNVITEKKKLSADGLIFDLNAMAPMERMMDLNVAFPKLSRTWKCEREDIKLNEQGKPGNRYDLSLTNFLLRGGFSHQEVIDTIIHFRRKNNDHPEKAMRQDYMLGTIAKVQRDIDKEKDKETIETVQDLEDLGYEIEGQKDRIKQTLSNLFNVEVLRIVQFLSEPEEWVLYTVKGRTKIGISENLTTQKKFRNIVAKNCKHFFKHQSTSNWDITVNNMLFISEDEELDESATELGIMKVWLRGFIEGKDKIDHQTAYEKKPFFFDGSWWIYPKGFKSWIYTSAVENITRQNIVRILKELDSVTKGFNVKKKSNGVETRSKIRAWKIPDYIVSGITTEKDDDYRKEKSNVLSMDRK